ncbi:serine protease related protein [Cyclospora cayetanensis]|uniref:Serine protease related protein n=1 Tax=Cyclospora cayetanensis TaxID=88456 RepID=A0A1D3CT67_9EIME|nr:serine protease related protein [Cyclospora cayetanensis]
MAVPEDAAFMLCAPPQMKHARTRAFKLALVALTAVWASKCTEKKRYQQAEHTTRSQYISGEYSSAHGALLCTNASRISQNVHPDRIATLSAILDKAADALVCYTSAVTVPAFCREVSRQGLQQVLRHEQLELQRAFEAIQPAVVRVYAMTSPEVDTPGSGRGDATQENQGADECEHFHFLGSGFFFDDHGYIVTAAHVLLRPKNAESDESACIGNGMEHHRMFGVDSVPFSLAVKDSEGMMYEACLCGVDAATDVAVLHLPGSKPKKIFSLQGKFKESRPVMGEAVVTYAALEHAEEPIGVAGRMLQPRQTFDPVGDTGGLSFLQLQLLTLPGMSGAPVCNMEGFVVGMLVKKFDLCGVAVPASIVLRVAEVLRDSGKFVPSSIGLLVEGEGLRLESKSGQIPTRPWPRVCGILPGGAAAKAGILEGDRIISVKGETTDSVGRVSTFLSFCRHFGWMALASGTTPQKAGLQEEGCMFW